MIAQIVCKWVLYLVLAGLSGTIIYGVIDTWDDVKDFAKEMF